MDYVLKSTLKRCFPEYTNIIDNDDVSFLFDSTNQNFLNFPMVNGLPSQNARTYRFAVQDLITRKEYGLLTPQDSVRLERELIKIYVHEMFFSRNGTFDPRQTKIFSFVPPFFGAQKFIVENRIQDKELYQALNKEFYASINKYNTIVDQKQSLTYPRSGYVDANKVCFDNSTLEKLLKTEKIEIENSGRLITDNIGKKYYVKYLIGKVDGQDVLFRKIATSRANFQNPQHDSAKVTLSVCLNGNSNNNVLLARLDFNPADPHVNSIEYTADKRIVLNTCNNKNDCATKRAALERNVSSHIHKYDENIAYIFPSKDAEGYVENVNQYFRNAKDLDNYFDSELNVNPQKLCNRNGYLTKDETQDEEETR